LLYRVACAAASCPVQPRFSGRAHSFARPAQTTDLPSPARARRVAPQRDYASAPAWVDECGELCVAAVGDAIGRAEDEALQQLLSKVLRAARLSGEEQVEVGARRGAPRPLARQ
jgi:hypothetical protein